MSTESSKIPVTILTGFLGSGKTTLLNWVLKAQHGKKLAVIENEFGQTDVDANLLQAREHSEETIVEVKNGCICCTVRGDLVVSLKNIWEKTKGKLDGVIIETTGLADPAPVCQTFFIEEDIQPKFEIDAVLTIVDAKHIIQHLDEIKPEGVENESHEQILFADKCLINKCDLVSKDDITEIRRRIKKINKFCDLMEVTLKDAPPEMIDVLGLGKFSLDRVTEMEPDFLKPEEHEHDQSVTSMGFVLNEDEQINLNYLQDWISELIGKHNQDLFRYKGVIAVKGKEKKFIFQGVHMLFGGDFAAEWGDEPRKSVFVFIGRNLPSMNIEEGFRKCIAAPLRFKVGDYVLANVGTYQLGIVIKEWDNGNPYRIQLQNPKRTEVWGPMDIDKFVKAAPRSMGTN